MQNEPKLTESRIRPDLDEEDIFKALEERDYMIRPDENDYLALKELHDKIVAGIAAVQVDFLMFTDACRCSRMSKDHLISLNVQEIDIQFIFLANERA